MNNFRSHFQIRRSILLSRTLLASSINMTESHICWSFLRTWLIDFDTFIFWSLRFYQLFIDFLVLHILIICLKGSLMLRQVDVNYPVSLHVLNALRNLSRDMGKHLDCWNGLMSWRCLSIKLSFNFMQGTLNSILLFCDKPLGRTIKALLHLPFRLNRRVFRGKRPFSFSYLGLLELLTV